MGAFESKSLEHPKIKQNSDDRLLADVPGSLAIRCHDYACDDSSKNLIEIETHIVPHAHLLINAKTNEMYYIQRTLKIDKKNQKTVWRILSSTDNRMTAAKSTFSIL